MNSRHNDWARARGFGASILVTCTDRLWGPRNLFLNGHWRSFPVVKRPGCDISHSHTIRVEVKNEWSYIPIPPIRLHGVDRKKIYFCTYTTYTISCTTKV